MGKTTGGLGATELAFGPSWEWRFDALRFGVGQETGYIEFPRETQPGHAMWGFGLGVRAFGSYDVFEFERHALYLGLDLSATLYFGRDGAPGPGIWGPMASFGFRY